MVYLQDPPCMIIRQLMLDLALASQISDNDDWPVFDSNMPDRPDDCIIVTDTDSLLDGRTQFDGETQEHFGFQVKIRSKGPVEGYRKLAEIAASFDDSVLKFPVDVGANSYTVQSITRRSGIIKMGKESVSARNLWSLNCTASIYAEGTGS
jgi:hypothetical protein